ncbi:KAP family NTPase [Burkholderia gladioli]|uniref:KAP family NTPase n=1 Tax=Burkholderia gladioli TaxID=28095 RepID=UPI00163E55E2|nr:KAP family NTPase [Burkholderia gladioli]
METEQKTKPPEAIRMPEVPMFARFLAIGFGAAEVFRIAFYLGANFIQRTPGLSIYARSIVVTGALLICALYCVKRRAHAVVARMMHSGRFDLLIVVAVGAGMNELAAPWLVDVHVRLVKVNPYWAPAVLLLLCTVLASPLFRRTAATQTPPSPFFLSDDEVREPNSDVLATEVQAKTFADTVLKSGAHPGLVFGVEGPWGVGKTSFINLASRHWEQADDQVIVCRFEPLRYASDPDVADRLIRDISAAIQRKIFAPEFRPAVSRYAKLIRGKADISFLGFKLSLEPSQETIEDLLEDIDNILKRIGRRVIIVIDDLDRLDVKTAYSLLFATRRTFSLSQATYVLCYDAEILAGDSEDGTKAREFLEKFVTVKMSLFVDNSSLRDLLRRDWSQSNAIGAIAPVAMVKLGSVLEAIATILDSDLAASYRPLLGDLRKVKRCINALVMMRIEEAELGQTDFHANDLIHLVLLHLGYPGLFRRLYAEETEGKTGVFSVNRKAKGGGYENSEEFSVLVKDFENRGQLTAGFLLRQLFDVTCLNFGDRSNIGEAELRSRACFNGPWSRNLENYLKLLVRFVVPMPQDTYILYSQGVERVRKGEPIREIFSSPDFPLIDGGGVHDQFWTVLVRECHTFPGRIVDDAIDTLLEYLPRYSAVGRLDRCIRHRAIYSLLVLLDRAGWVDGAGRHHENRPEYVVQIARRIFDWGPTMPILERLVAGRGVLGWNDLMLFRLNCSPDRTAQLFNLYRGLMVYQDPNSSPEGEIPRLARRAMRKLSQEAFKLFEREYIVPQRNFYQEVDGTPEKDFFGTDSSMARSGGSTEEHVAAMMSAARYDLKTFVIYQLSNSRGPNSGGVGCGYYDPAGDEDQAGIARRMNDYMFRVCFNPRLDSDNALHFLDHCLMHLGLPIFTGDDIDKRYTVSKAELPGGLNPTELGKFWQDHRDILRQRLSSDEARTVTTSNYTATYRDDLPGVFDVLDELANEAAGAD